MFERRTLIQLLMHRPDVAVGSPVVARRMSLSTLAGILQRELLRDHSAHAVAQNARLLHLQLVEQRGQVVCHPCDGIRLVRRACAPGAAVVVGNHAKVLGQRGHLQRPCLQVAAKSSDEHQRLPGTGFFVVRDDVARRDVRHVARVLRVSLAIVRARGSYQPSPREGSARSSRLSPPVRAFEPTLEPVKLRTQIRISREHSGTALPVLHRR